jgi:hypothetical protein
MALLCGRIDHNTISILGRWHSDAMIRYLHLQAKPLMKHFPQPCSTTAPIPSSLPIQSPSATISALAIHSFKYPQKTNKHINNRQHHPKTTSKHDIIIPHSVQTRSFTTPHPIILGSGFRQRTAIGADPNPRICEGTEFTVAARRSRGGGGGRNLSQHPPLFSSSGPIPLFTR